MKEEKDGDAVAKQGFSGFVAQDGHGQKGAGAAAEGGEKNQSRLGNAAFISTRPRLVECVDGEGNEVEDGKGRSDKSKERFGHGRQPFVQIGS